MVHYFWSVVAWQDTDLRSTFDQILLCGSLRESSPFCSRAHKFYATFRETRRAMTSQNYGIGSKKWAEKNLRIEKKGNGRVRELLQSFFSELYFFLSKKGGEKNDNPILLFLFLRTSQFRRLCQAVEALPQRELRRRRSTRRKELSYLTGSFHRLTWAR